MEEREEGEEKRAVIVERWKGEGRQGRHRFEWRRRKTVKRQI